MAAIDKTRANGVRLYGGTYRTDQADFSASGPVTKLFAGTIQGAVGVDWREESFFFSGDNRQNLSSSDALIFNAPFDNSLATAGTLKRTIKAAYAELQIPLLRGLDFNAAGRIDEYTGFGASTNPKFTLRWAPSDAFLVRSSYSTGFRVPSFKQMFDPVTESPLAATGLIDPGTGQQIAPNTATVLFGHRESWEDLIRHLDRIRSLQRRTGGFTEFVPLAFVPYRNRLGGALAREAGVSPEALAEAGADVLVAGNSVFGQPDPAAAVRSFKALLG